MSPDGHLKMIDFVSLGPGGKRKRDKMEATFDKRGKKCGFNSSSYSWQQEETREIPAEACVHTTALPGGTGRRWIAAKCFLNRIAVLRL